MGVWRTEIQSAALYSKTRSLSRKFWKISFTYMRYLTKLLGPLDIYIYIYIVMRSIPTFRSTTERTNDGGPIT